MPVQGLVRLRKHQLARQQVFGTPVAATRAYPFSGVPTPDLAWTDSELDAGSLDPVAPPTRGAPDLTAPPSVPQLGYNTLTAILCGFFGGEVSPTGGGTAKTWTHEPASTTADDFDPFTYEFGDDVTTDWYQFGDGIIESFEITGPEGLGALSASMAWRFGSMGSSGSTDMPDSPVVPTAGLTIDTAEKLIYLKDGLIRIASSEAGLAAGQISDALHSFTLRASQEVDQKRWANGTQSFNVNAYGRGARTIELEMVFSKTADTVGIGSESDAWMSNDAVNRYIQMSFTSLDMAEGATPYSWLFTLPARIYTRTEGEIGGNTTIVLTARAFYDAVDLEGVFNSVLVNTLTEAQLGLAGS